MCTSSILDRKISKTSFAWDYSKINPLVWFRIISYLRFGVLTIIEPIIKQRYGIESV